MKLKIIKMALLLLVFSCTKKEDEKSTPITTPTASSMDTNYYFEAKVNGQLFKANMTSCECTTPSDFKTEAYIHSNGLYLRAKKDPNDAKAGEFFISAGNASNNYSGVGDYVISQGFSTEASGQYTLGDTTWYSGGAYPGNGTITISKDENKIVEGTFYFEANTSSSSKNKNVTEGRFRMKY